MKNPEPHSQFQPSHRLHSRPATIRARTFSSVRLWRRTVRHAIFGAALALGLGVTTDAALAQGIAVSAQHSVVAVSEDVDRRTWLTLSVTLTNGGDTNLADVRLLTSPGLSPQPDIESNALLIGDLARDASVTKDWTFETLFVPSDGEAFPGPALFLGEATDAFGDFVAFPVNSTPGEE